MTILTAARCRSDRVPAPSLAKYLGILCGDEVESSSINFLSLESGCEFVVDMQSREIAVRVDPSEVQCAIAMLIGGGANTRH